jgi:hypothetical protein
VLLGFAVHELTTIRIELDRTYTIGAEEMLPNKLCELTALRLTNAKSN